MNSYLYKYGGILALTLQQSAMPLLVRFTRFRAPDDVFITTVNVFMMDVFKFVVCACILVNSSSLFQFGKQLHEALWVRRAETLKMSVPAIIYVLQNNLYYIAGSHLEATTVYICYQLKMFTTAFLMRVMLGRMLSTKQWLALCLLVLGVIDVQLVYAAPSGSARAEIEQNPVVGFAAVLLMCCTSALAGVYLEKVLKGSDESVWIQNVRLALVSMPISIMSMIFYDAETIRNDGFFKGWDFWVLALTVFNSIGGLLIAIVIKFADNILKAFAQSMAIIGAAVGSWLLFDFVPNAQFVLGAVMVMASIIIYALNPYKSQQQVFDFQKLKTGHEGLLMMKPVVQK